jgi:hypothetical protein
MATASQLTSAPSLGKKIKVVQRFVWTSSGDDVLYVKNSNKLTSWRINLQPLQNEIKLKRIIFT